MKKIVASRSGWWRFWIWNWNQDRKEQEYLKQLEVQVKAINEKFDNVIDNVIAERKAVPISHFGQELEWEMRDEMAEALDEKRERFEENLKEKLKIEAEELERQKEEEEFQRKEQERLKKEEATVAPTSPTAGPTPVTGGASTPPGMPPVNPGPGMPPLPPQPTPNISLHMAVGGQSYGPYNWDVCKQLVQNGQLTAQTIVWMEGMAAWGPAGQVPTLQPLFAPAAPPMPPATPGMPPMPPTM
jgi:hypothetical protein